MEWILDLGASNHMTGNASLFTSYDKEKHLAQKVSISDGNNISVVGFGNVDVPNGVLEDVFHVEGMPINFLLFIMLVKKDINLKLGMIICLERY
jgi:hypothetical protein